MRIAVTGSQGQVARSLVERGATMGASVIAVGRPTLDLADPSTILPALRAAAPDVIVNAAAFTGVDAAESEEALAHQINAEGAGAVAKVAAELSVPIIHLSTDYVFNGMLDRPYSEGDVPEPINAYGRSKLAGEEAVKTIARRHVILRTAWVYSPFGRNFLRAMLAAAETRQNVRVVADQLGQPTSALDIADGILAICQRLRTKPQDEALFGTFHMTAQGAASWADFAEAIFAERERRGRSGVTVSRIASRDYETAARRPANSRLDTAKLAAAYGIVLPPWHQSVSEVTERLLATS
ncbi:MAG: dTDP-4-dehydrorhamnose reductase [Methylovirgula sp.]|jgi:dTDP-4-dehydrorhamnose reductase